MSRATINHPDRLFPADAATREIARSLYQEVRSLPIVSPHGHVDPRLFADPDYQFGTPTELLIIPDHYVFRMLYSQGIPLEECATEEVMQCAGQRVGAPGVGAWNPVFDVTPAELVDAIVTEKGVVTHPTAERMRALFP